MKFTKRAYTKVWQNCPENEKEDTTITLYDYEDANEINSTPIAPLYLPKCHTSVNSMEDSNIPEHCPTAESSDLVGFVDPLSCHNYGQRSKYIEQDQLAYKHQSNRTDILHTLKLKAETQPTFDLTELNQ